MTTIQDNIASPFIRQLAQSIFGTQQQYIDDLLKIKRLMNKTKLGILSEQLFIILKQKYPQEYTCLLMEQNNEPVMVINKEERKNKVDAESSVGKKSQDDSILKKTEKEKEQQSFQHWVNHYGRP